MQTIPTTIPTAGPRSTGRRRGTRVAAAVLAASALASGLGIGVAGAETPPAPEQPFELKAPPPPLVADVPLANPVGVNTHTAGNYVATSRGDTWVDATFTSTAPSLVLQFSTTKPTWVDGEMTMGAVSPQYLVGTPVKGDIDDFAAEKTYSYSFSRDGLTPWTQYYVLVSMAGKPGQKTTYSTWTTTTEHRFVRMTPVEIKVIDDADDGLKGAGELSFGFRIAPEGDPYGYSTWGSWTKQVKLKSGQSWNLWGTGHGDWKETKSNTAVVQIQGMEDDTSLLNWNCPIEGGEKKPEQFSDGCQDWAFAEAWVPLPSGRYEGTHTQYVWAKVQRSPELRFDVLVKVDTWAK